MTTDDKLAVLAKSLDESTGLTGLWVFCFGWLWFLFNGFFGAAALSLIFFTVLGGVVSLTFESNPDAGLGLALLLLVTYLLQIPLAYKAHAKKAQKKALQALLLKSL